MDKLIEWAPLLDMLLMVVSCILTACNSLSAGGMVGNYGILELEERFSTQSSPPLGNSTSSSNISFLRVLLTLEFTLKRSLFFYGAFASVPLIKLPDCAWSHLMFSKPQTLSLQDSLAYFFFSSSSSKTESNNHFQSDPSPQNCF